MGLKEFTLGGFMENFIQVSRRRVVRTDRCVRTGCSGCSGMNHCNKVLLPAFRTKEAAENGVRPVGHIPKDIVYEMIGNQP